MKIYTISYKAKRGGAVVTTQIVAHSKCEAQTRAMDQLKSWYTTQVRILGVDNGEDLR